ncbi:MAG TPA: Ig-like domain-containing protein, partial [Methylomirabilota bacterium]|nr:Ig-like domain-containing protein [Methylomirabilota bacterium]
TPYVILRDEEDLYVGGSFSQAGGVNAANVARWDGTQWWPLGDGLSGGSVRALAIFEGQLIAGGTFTTAGGSPVGYIAAFDGSNWSALGDGVSASSPSEQNPPVRAMEVWDGKLVVGGAFDGAGGVMSSNVAVWDGIEWSSLGSDGGNGVDGPVRKFQVDAAGDLAVGGAFRVAGGQSNAFLARWDGTQWDTYGDGLYFNNNGGRVDRVLREGNDLYALGIFTTDDQPDPPTRYLLARWDGSAWHNLPAMGGLVHDYTISGGEIYLAQKIPGGGARSGIQRLEGETWKTLGMGLDAEAWTFDPGPPGEFAMGGPFNYGGRLHSPRLLQFIDGAWSRVESPDNRPVYAFSRNAAGEFLVNGWRQEGIDWTLMGEGLPEIQWIHHHSRGPWAQVQSGIEVYVGGGFGVMRWNGSTWVPLGTGFSGGWVNALVMRRGELYAGGSFTNVSGKPILNLARWDGREWQQVGGGVDAEVRALAFLGDELVVGGRITTAGGTAHSRLAVWNGSDWEALGGGVAGGVNAINSIDESRTVVNGLAVTARGDLMVAGNFTQAGTLPALHCARWDGSNWHAFGTGLDRPADAVACADDRVFFGGPFSEAGGVASSGLAIWHETPLPLLLDAQAPESVLAGEMLSYSLSVENVSPLPLEGVVLRQPLPPGTEFVSATDGGTVIEGEVVWELGSLDADASPSEVGLTVSVQAISGTIESLDHRVETDGVGPILGRPIRTTVVPGGEPPVISFLSPSEGAEFPILSDVTLAVEAMDSDGSVEQVDFFQGGDLLRSVAQPPYELVLEDLRAGEYAYRVVARDDLGMISSSTITFRIARPTNDDFANREAIIGIEATVTGVNISATSEPGEPEHEGFWVGNSVWWSWTAPSAALVTVTTAGTTFRNVLGVYTGDSVSDLTLVALAKYWPAFDTTVTFMAQTDVDYQIVVDGGYPPSEGHVTLSLMQNILPEITISTLFDQAAGNQPGVLSIIPEVSDADGTIRDVRFYVDQFPIETRLDPPYEPNPVLFAGGTFSVTAVAFDNQGLSTTSAVQNVTSTLPNDDFADRIPLAGAGWSVFGSTEGATAEPGESLANNGDLRKSVWWNWKAPASGRAFFNVDGPDYINGLFIFTGSSLGSLTEIAIGSQSNPSAAAVSFDSVAGTDYIIMLDGMPFGSGVSEGKYRLSLVLNAPNSLSLRAMPRTSEGSQPLRLTGEIGQRAVLD